MNTTAFRRVGAMVCTAAVVTTITATTPATAKVEQGTTDRPCFMVRHPWNNAEGPQPICPNGRFTKDDARDAGGTVPVPRGRTMDFMP
jgi:hypothetical protein